MLEVYSKNVTVAENASVPLNNTVLIKGTSSQLQGASTIQLNKCGIYQVAVSAVAIGSDAGEISLQMRKDGVLQPQAITAVTAADSTSLNPMSFVTLVQVPQNNCPNCICSAPTTIDFVNTGIETEYSTFDVVVTRI